MSGTTFYSGDKPMTENDLLTFLRHGLPRTAEEVAHAIEVRTDSILTGNHMPTCADSNVLALMQTLGEILAPILGGR